MHLNNLISSFISKNQLLILTATEQQAIYPIITIGKFTGRKEAVYKTHHPQNSLFVFVIEGAFEVHGRLMHPRDGLGLWDNSGDIELEALSNDAIILLIEMITGLINRLEY